MRFLMAACVAFFGLTTNTPAHAQPVSLGETLVQSPVLVIEMDRVYAQSLFGMRVSSELEAEGAHIASENRRIESELTEEERLLTEKRASVPAAEFQQLATEFDEKVQRLRAEQDAKARALGAKSEQARRLFIASSQPILERLMRETGAAIILEKRTVFVAADAIDITDRAIVGIDAAIGSGGSISHEDSDPAQK